MEHAPFATPSLLQLLLFATFSLYNPSSLQYLAPPCNNCFFYHLATSLLHQRLPCETPHFCCTFPSQNLLFCNTFPLQRLLSVGSAGVVMRTTSTGTAPACVTRSAGGASMPAEALTRSLPTSWLKSSNFYPRRSTERRTLAATRTSAMIESWTLRKSATTWLPRYDALHVVIFSYRFVCGISHGSWEGLGLGLMKWARGLLFYRHNERNIKYMPWGLILST